MKRYLILLVLLLASCQPPKEKIDAPDETPQEVNACDSLLTQLVYSSNYLEIVGSNWGLSKKGTEYVDADNILDDSSLLVHSYLVNQAGANPRVGLTMTLGWLKINPYKRSFYATSFAEDTLLTIQYDTTLLGKYIDNCFEEHRQRILSMYQRK